MRAAAGLQVDGACLRHIQRPFLGPKGIGEWVKILGWAARPTEKEPKRSPEAKIPDVKRCRHLGITSCNDFLSIAHWCCIGQLCPSPRTLSRLVGPGILNYISLLKLCILNSNQAQSVLFFMGKEFCHVSWSTDSPVEVVCCCWPCNCGPLSHVMLNSSGDNHTNIYKGSTSTRRQTPQAHEPTCPLARSLATQAGQAARYKYCARIGLACEASKHLA